MRRNTAGNSLIDDCQTDDRCYSITSLSRIGAPTRRSRSIAGAPGDIWKVPREITFLCWEAMCSKSSSESLLLPVLTLAGPPSSAPAVTGPWSRLHFLLTAFLIEHVQQQELCCSLTPVRSKGAALAAWNPETLLSATHQGQGHRSSVKMQRSSSSLCTTERGNPDLRKEVSLSLP